MAEQKRPPYTSAGDLDGLFERMKSIGDPGTIDTKWVTSYNIASSQPEGVVAALKWLGVIDKDGKSNGLWNELRVPATRAETLQRLMNEAYADVFSRVDVAEASRQDLEGAFISAYSSGNTGRLIGCFLTLCRHAGIETKATQRRSSAASASNPARKAPASAAIKPTEANPTPNNPMRSKPTPNKPTAKLVAADGHVAIALTLNVEIPADWSDEQVAQRISSVRRAIEAA